jgi:hypothetical protein
VSALKPRITGLRQATPADSSSSMRITRAGPISCQVAALTVDLLTVDALNVDDPFLTVHLCDLALTALQHTQHQQTQRSAARHEQSHRAAFLSTHAACLCSYANACTEPTTQSKQPTAAPCTMPCGLTVWCCWCQGHCQQQTARFALTLNVPRTTCTSSSFLMGTERTCSTRQSKSHVMHSVLCMPCPKLPLLLLLPLPPCP